MAYVFYLYLLETSPSNDFLNSQCHSEPENNIFNILKLINLIIYDF